MTWKLLADKSDTSVIAYPSDWNELYVVASADDVGYGWSTVSMIIPKAMTANQYITAEGRSITLVVYKGNNGISIESQASSAIQRWKAYYR